MVVGPLLSLKRSALHDINEGEELDENRRRLAVGEADRQADGVPLLALVTLEADGNSVLSDDIPLSEVVRWMK